MVVLGHLMTNHPQGYQVGFIGEVTITMMRLLMLIEVVDGIFYLMLHVVQVSMVPHLLYSLHLMLFIYGNEFLND